MADQADRRSEGKKSTHRGSVYNRARIKRLKAAGLCVYCGTTPVQNRNYCHECADTKHLPMVYESNARKVFKAKGVTRESLDTRIGQALALDILQDLFSRGRA